MFSNIMIMNTLINSYTKFRRVKNAHILFYKMHDENIVLLIAIIERHKINDYNNDALNLFYVMKHLEPTLTTYSLRIV